MQAQYAIDLAEYRKSHPKAAADDDEEEGGDDKAKAKAAKPKGDKAAKPRAAAKTPKRGKDQPTLQFKVRGCPHPPTHAHTRAI